MFERIIIPLDRSTLSESAIPVGIVLARTLGSSIDYLHVIDKDTPSKTAEAAAYLERIAGRFPPPNEPRLQVRTGEAEEAIVEAAGDADAMIVMATHGYTGLRRMIFGSVADAVVRHARVPITLVRGHSDFRIPQERLQRLLVPIDGSQRSAQAVPLAIEIARRSGARLDLLHVVVPVSVTDAGAGMDPGYIPPDVYASMMNDLETVAREDLEAAALICMRAGVDATLHRPIGTPVDSITHHAEEVGADAIVMSTHGRGGASRVLLGSVALGTIHRSRVPVIVIPPSYAESGTHETREETVGESVADHLT